VFNQIFSIWRWIQIVVFAFLGCISLKFGGGFIPKTIYEALSDPDNFGVVFCLGIVLLVYLNWVAGFRFRHIKSLIKYPSFLFAVILSSIVIDYYPLNSAQVFVDFFRIPHVGFTSAVYIFSLLITGTLREVDCLIAKPKADLEKRTKPAGGIFSNFSVEQIIEWAKCETPITSEEEDFLGFSYRADRVLEYLLKRERNTVAIVGYYGAGKTSLTELAAKRAGSTHKDKLLFASVSCWGFNDATAAQEAVLGQIVAELSECGDCFAIEGMPSRFVKALSGTSNYLESFFSFIAPKDPDAQLKQICPILRALGVRLVVVVEDTERKGAQFDMAIIEGLLNRFRGISDISFVITASPDAMIDFVRLCEHTEVIPDLESEIVIKIISRVREHCLSKFPNDIDLIERKQLTEVPLWFGADKYGFWELQLSKIINTPRKLKATVRRFYNAWEALHGEVDVDELIIASCLRVCAPSAFGFLMRRHNEFARIVTKNNKQQNEPDLLLIRLRKEWAELNDQGFELAAAGKLLSVLDSASRPIFEEGSYRHVNIVQEFRSKDRKVYRARIFDERLSNDGILDQEVLHEITKAKTSGDWKQLGKKLEESKEFREIFDPLSRYMLGKKLTSEDLWQIVKEIFSIIRAKYGVKASDESPAYFAAIEWIRSCSPRLQERYEQAYKEIEACIPKNLQLATDIYSSLIQEGASDQILIEYGNRVMVLLKMAFDNAKGFELLADSLDTESPTTLDRLLRYNNSRGSNVRDWKKWSWLGPTLLKGIKKYPQKFVPQVSIILGLAYRPTPDLPQDFLLNEPVLESLFGGDARDVMIEMSKSHEINLAIENLIEGIDFLLINPRAQKWLEKSAR
jgi:hypothetical protein